MSDPASQVPEPPAEVLPPKPSIDEIEYAVDVIKEKGDIAKSLAAAIRKFEGKPTSPFVCFQIAGRLSKILATHLSVDSEKHFDVSFLEGKVNITAKTDWAKAWLAIGKQGL